MKTITFEQQSVELWGFGACLVAGTFIINIWKWQLEVNWS